MCLIIYLCLIITLGRMNRFMCLYILRRNSSACGPASISSLSKNDKKSVTFTFFTLHAFKMLFKLHDFFKCCYIASTTLKFKKDLVSCNAFYRDITRIV